jgi:hypothetical protein
MDLRVPATGMSLKRDGAEFLRLVEEIEDCSKGPGALDETTIETGVGDDV